MIVLDESRIGDRVYDVCVMGAGPAGLAVGLACAERGLSVALLEAGGLKAGPITALSVTNLTPNTHQSTDQVLRAGLGGTSSAWGGTCVPYDPADFATQWFDDSSEWPISYPEMIDWYRDASTFLGLRDAADFFGHEPGWADDVLDPTQHHYVSSRQNIGLLHKAALRRSRLIDLYPETVLTAFQCDTGGSRVHIARTEGRRGQASLCAGAFVLAGGGLATTQALIKLAADCPQPFAKGRSHLGRYYMGHLSGVLATMVFRRPADALAFLYTRAGQGVWKQRRLKFQTDFRVQNGLLNTAFVLRSPMIEDERHGSGALSAINLAMPLLRALRRSDPTPRPACDARSPAGGKSRHIQNILREPARAALDLGQMVTQTYTSNIPRLVYNKGGRYALDYHAEQVPNYDSRVQMNTNGARDLTIDYKFLPLDIDSVLKSHDLLDRNLQAAGIGHLEYTVRKEDRRDLVIAQAVDGYHQIGTTRMSRHAEHGVVDPNCRVFGFQNLYVASSSSFPTAGSANPTLTTVALARRLGSHLAMGKP